ncbi:hypothetical protein LBMAG12_08350 [Actinomycetes bacterium]|nr:hypothetical protein LBMAG12_08350 [Actinomycetes bacterium]
MDSESGANFKTVRSPHTVFADAANRHHGVVFAANAEDGGAIVGFNVPEP